MDIISWRGEDLQIARSVRCSLVIRRKANDAECAAAELRLHAYPPIEDEVFAGPGKRPADGWPGTPYRAITAPDLIGSIFGGIG